MTLQRGVSIFWVLYALFFAIPFPMILYYNINYSGGGARHVFTLSGSYWALSYLAVAVILWGVLLACYFRRWFILPAQEQRHMEAIRRDGVLREAEVVAWREAGKPKAGVQSLEVTLGFDNLSGVPIQETLLIVDMQPHLGRFKVGQHLRVRVDPNLSKSPILVLEGSEVESNKKRNILKVLAWLLIVGVVASYFILSYHYEHQGTGWRFLTFFHPLLICPICLLGLPWLLGDGMKKYFISGRSFVALKYRGYQAQARLMEVKQTGTYINEQPQVRFELEYEDLHGVTHRTSYKKIVDLMEMEITRAKVLPIFYLADQPKHVAFASDLI